MRPISFWHNGIVIRDEPCFVRLVGDIEDAEACQMSIDKILKVEYARFPYMKCPHKYARRFHKVLEKFCNDYFHSINVKAVCTFNKETKNYVFVLKSDGSFTISNRELYFFLALWRLPLEFYSSTADLNPYFHKMYSLSYQKDYYSCDLLNSLFEYSASYEKSGNDHLPFSINWKLYAEPVVWTFQKITEALTKTYQVDRERVYIDSLGYVMPSTLDYLFFGNFDRRIDK